MPNLSRLAPEDQPVLADAEGVTIPKKVPPMASGGGDGGVNTEPPQDGPQDFGAENDPLAPDDYPLDGSAAPPPEEPLDDEALSAGEVTDDEAQQIGDLEESLAGALEDDADEPPADSPLNLEDGALLALFESRMNKASAFRLPFEKRWLNAWLNYNQILQGESAAWKSQVFLPLVFQQVTAAIPPMVAAIYDSGPVWEARALKPEHASRAKAVTALLDWYMREKTPSARRLRDLLWYSTLFGTGFMLVKWSTKIGTLRRIAPVHLAGEKEGTKGAFLSNRLRVDKGQVIEDIPVLENIDIWDAFPAPHTRDDDYFPYFIQRVEPTIEDLRSMYTSGFLGDDGKERVEEWLLGKPEEDMSDGNMFGQATSKANAWRQVGMNSQFDASWSEDGDRSKSPLVIFIMWTDEYVVVVSGDGTEILGKAPNPYWFKKVPIVAHHFERVPGCIFGRGIGDIIEGIQKQANFNYNKGNDAVQLALNAPIAVRQVGNGLVQGQVAWQPGALIPCRDPGSDIKPLIVPDPMNAVFRLEDHLMAHADRSTGVNDISHGMSPEGANTATEFAGLQSQVRIRLSQHVREIKTTMGRIGSLLLKLVQQFVDEPIAIRVTGKKGLDYVKVSPEDVVQSYDLIPSANSVRSNPAMLRADVAALMPTMVSSPFVKQDEWMRYVLRTFEIPEPEAMIQEPPPPPRMPESEEMALSLGIEVPPSPDEDFEYHLLIHQQAMATLPPTGPSFAAHKKHFEDTLNLKSQVLMAQAPPAAAAPGGATGQPPQAAPPGGGKNEARRGASSLGKAQGGGGPGGASPGPNGPPNRKNA